MDIVKIVMNQLGSQKNLDSIAKRAGTDTSVVQKVAQMGLPAIMEGLNKRTSEDPQASEELAAKAANHADDDTDHMDNYLDKSDEKEGNRLLDMAFGSKEQDVENRIAEKTGTDSSKVKEILSMLAPLALSMIAKRSSSSQSLTGSGVSQLLGGLADGVKQQSSGSGLGGILSSALGDSSSADSGNKGTQGSTLDKAKDTLGSMFDNK